MHFAAASGLHALLKTTLALTFSDNFFPAQL